MIEKLPEGTPANFEFTNKINELINGYNELHEKLDPLTASLQQDGTVTWSHNLVRNEHGQYVKRDV